MVPPFDALNRNFDVPARDEDYYSSGRQGDHRGLQVENAVQHERNCDQDDHHDALVE